MPITPNMLNTSVAALLLSATVATAAGCQSQPQGLSEADKADIRDSWNPHPAEVVHPTATTLIEGPAPLFYEVPASGNLQVTDAASGAAIVSADVSRGTIIRIEPDQGIYAGPRQLRPGPLTPGRRYGIVMGAPAANDWRSSVQAPHPASPPATHPAGERNGPLF